MALLLALAMPTSAQAYVYWVDQADSSPGTSSIGRVNLDGSSPNPSFIPGGSNTTQVVVANNFIYWGNDVDSVNGTIGRANLDGTGVNQNYLTGLGIVSGIAVDSTYAYWSNGSAIGRIKLDGSDISPTFINGASGGGIVRGLALDSSRIYWANWDDLAIGRADIDGANQQSTWIDVSPEYPASVAVTPTNVYWSIWGGNLPGTGAIGRAKIDGSAGQTFITGGTDTWAVAVDATNIYWANRDIGRLGSSLIDGSAVNQSFLTNVGVPVSVAIAPDPTVAAVTPATGPFAGGTAVTITGSNFQAGSTVNLSGSACTSPMVVSATSITCTTSSHAVGAVNVTVTSPDGPSGTLANGFTYGKVNQTQGKKTYPRSIESQGTTVLNKSGARTQQGRKMRAHVQVSLLEPTTSLRGDLACYSLARGPKRKLTITTTGLCALKVRVRYSAPGNAQYLPYSRTFTYRTHS